MANKDQVFSNFKSQTGKYSKTGPGRYGGPSLFYEGRVLYSFGYHFPLVVKASDELGEDGFGCGVKYIVNGDKYSVTTTQHQNQAIKSCKPNVQVPFSALISAWNWAWKDRGSSILGAATLAKRLMYGEDEFKIVNYRSDTWQHSHDDGKTRAPNYFGGYVETGEPSDMGVTACGEAGCEYVGRVDTDVPAQSRHKLGAVLFTIRDHSFLSSFDEQDRGNYFLCQVPGSPATVEEAYENLKPQGVKDCEKLSHPVLRQGDWFFLACSVDTKLMKQLKPTELSDFRLGGTSGTHVVTRARKSEASQLYVRGIVRHSPTDGRRPEHRRLKLGTGKDWWVPVKNTSEAGWGAVGNVD